MEEKLQTLRESVELIKNGDAVAIGRVKPMAIVREIIRQKKKNLRLYFMVGDYEVDMLCGAGCVSEAHGLFVVPTAGPHFRRGVESGELRMIDEGEVPLYLSVLAGSKNIPFIPLKGYQNDIVTIHPQWKRFKSPINDEELLAIPALVIDAAILHLPRADVYGNIQSPEVFVYDRIAGWWDKHISMAAKQTIISVDEIIDNDKIRANPERTLIPFYDVDAVAEAERGAHPLALPGVYDMDMKHLKIYSQACEDAANYQAYLRKYVMEPRDQREYLALVNADA